MPSTYAETLAAIQAFCATWPHAEFGPGHIVLSDYNLCDAHIQWCLDYVAAGCPDTDLPPLDELFATTAFLRSLLTIPEAVRVPDA